MKSDVPANGTLNIIESDDTKTDQNHKIVEGSSDIDSGYSGIVHNGYVRVHAGLKPGETGKIELKFKAGAISVTNGAFAILRSLLQGILEPPYSEEKIAEQAGLSQYVQPGESRGRMSVYASHLFADLYFNGVVKSNAETKFEASADRSKLAAMNAVRSSRTHEILMAGTILVDAPIGGKSTDVFIPITTIRYTDGVTIPFVGYGDNVIVKTNEGLKGYALDAVNWALNEIFSG